MTEYGHRSIRQLVDTWQPQFNEQWKQWIRRAHGLISSSDPSDKLNGSKEYAVILVDSGAPEACYLVALRGIQFAKDETEKVGLEIHIRTVTHRLGMERHIEYDDPVVGVPVNEFKDRTKWLVHGPAYESWRQPLLVSCPENGVIENVDVTL